MNNFSFQKLPSLEVTHNQPENDTNLIEMGKRMPQRYEHSRTTCISQMGIKKLFYIFKPIILHFLNSLQSGQLKLGPRMTRSWEKGAQELQLFDRN
jgi:hypothetical protein